MFSILLLLLLKWDIIFTRLNLYSMKDVIWSVLLGVITYCTVLDGHHHLLPASPTKFHITRPFLAMITSSKNLLILSTLHIWSHKYCCFIWHIPLMVISLRLIHVEVCLRLNGALLSVGRTLLPTHVLALSPVDYGWHAAVHIGLEHLLELLISVLWHVYLEFLGHIIP